MPSIVSTAAVAGTDAALSFSAVGGCSFIWLAAGAGDCGGAVFGGAACAQASVPSKTHSSQLLRINCNPPGLVHSKGEDTKQEILAQSLHRASCTGSHLRSELSRPFSIARVTLFPICAQ